MLVITVTTKAARKHATKVVGKDVVDGIEGALTMVENTGDAIFDGGELTIKLPLVVLSRRMLTDCL